MGYKKYYRVYHGNDQFVKGKRPINGIESFWSFAKRRLMKFHGVPQSTFYFHLKECGSDSIIGTTQNIYQVLLKILREKPLN